MPMMNELIQFKHYVDSPRIEADYALGLAAKLERAAPADIEPHERQALDGVVTHADMVAEVRTQRERFSAPKIAPYRFAVTTAFTSLHDALVAISNVDPGVSDHGTRARAVIAKLFPVGVTFVKAAALPVWSEAKRILRRVDEEELADEIDALVGAALLANARKATRELADAVGVGEHVTETPRPGTLRDKLFAFRRALGAYGRALAAKVRDDDPASVERFLAAVAPIDELRVTTAPSDDEDLDVDEEDDVDADVVVAPTDGPAPVPAG